VLLWKNILEPARAHTAIWRGRIACWTTKATNAHSEYAILVVFPRQQWLHERTSVLVICTYIACSLVILFVTGTLDVYEGLSSSGAPHIDSFTEVGKLPLMYEL